MAPISIRKPLWHLVWEQVQITSERDHRAARTMRVWARTDGKSTCDVRLKNKLLNFISAPLRVEDKGRLTEVILCVSYDDTSHTHCSLRVDRSVPGHLYSFLACAMSPLLSLVRWPMAGRMPFSSLDGRMVSRNIPLQRAREGQGIYLWNNKTSTQIKIIHLFTCEKRFLMLVQQKLEAPEP